MKGDLVAFTARNGAIGGPRMASIHQIDQLLEQIGSPTAGVFWSY